MVTEASDVTEEDKEGGWCEYKVMLCDLGEGKLIDNQGIPSTLGNLYGPLLYRAPEVRKGDPYTIKSDVYSFGVVLFKLLKHAAEVGGSSMVPTKLLEIFQRCTKENPEERPSRILDVVFELERLHDDEWLKRKLELSDFFAFVKKFEQDDSGSDSQEGSMGSPWFHSDETSVSSNIHQWPITMSSPP